MTRFVFLHGFTQTHHHWHRPASYIANRIAARCRSDLNGADRFAFVDLPGHGLASNHIRGDLRSDGQRLLEVAGGGVYVGYSMGGRTALHAALGDYRQQIQRLVLIGATAGIADPSERQRRVDLDHARAAHIEAVGVAAFLDEWLRLPLFAGLPQPAADVEHRCRNTVAGLAGHLRTRGTGSQDSLWDQLTNITIPVLLLAGANDTKFTEIGQRMAAALPNGTLAIVPGAGHAVHAEQPHLVADEIVQFVTG